jgi:hypothetical protein
LNLTWNSKWQNSDKNGKLLKSPDLTTIELIANQMSFLNDVVVKEIDSSDSMLIFEEILKKAEHELFSFSKKFESISNRHSTSEANRQEELKYDEIVEVLRNHFSFPVFFFNFFLISILSN